MPLTIAPTVTTLTAPPPAFSSAALAGQPLTGATLAAYVSWLFDRGQALLTAKLVLSTVKFPTELKSQSAIRGQGQVAGLTWEQADTLAAQAAGMAGRVSGHSLRVGSAQSLAREGAGEVEMQTMGRWKSPTMPALYARKQLARRGAVARLRYGVTA